MAEATDSVRVAVRVRPLSAGEHAQKCEECLGVAWGRPEIVIGGDGSKFTFDYVFGQEATQKDIYEECVGSLVDSAFEGFNATILAYGQTGSGKTHTMGSASNVYLMEEDQGIIPRVIRAVFEKIREIETSNAGVRYTIRAQFLEIYGEDIKDLLTNSDATQVTIRENQQGDVYVAGAKEEVVRSTEDMLMVLEKGSLCRTTAATLMNSTSSRSHAIFTVLMEKQTTSPSPMHEPPRSGQQGEGGGDGAGSGEGESQLPVQNEVEIVRSKFHFVDLAGSERAKRTGASGVRLKEGIDINKGLLALGNVISALGDDEKRGKVHVPYRDSKLTRMLQDSLGGNSHTLMICCVSPADSNMTESLNAVRYANRARNIKNTPVVNYGDRSSAVIAELRQKVASLAQQLMNARGGGGDANPEEGVSTEALASMAAWGGTGGPQGSMQELVSLQRRLAESDAEVQRLNEKLKEYKRASDEQSEKILQVSAEKEYFRMQLSDAAPEHAATTDRADDAAGSQVRAIKDYLTEISSLQSKLEAAERELVQLKHQHSSRDRSRHREQSDDAVSLPSSESRLRRRSLSAGSEEDEDSDEDEDEEEDEVQKGGGGGEIGSGLLGGATLRGQKAGRSEDDEKAFEVSQRKMSAQVAALDHNIESKEDLLKQLGQKTQQYDLMRQFYEGKLAQMKEQVTQKQIEHDKVAGELKELAGQKEKSAKQIERQRELERKLASKDAELSKLRQKQRELSQLSKLKQALESQQQRLLREVSGMKRQKVDVVKKMDAEKKRWMQQIANTQREIQGMKKAARKDAQTIQKLDVARQQAEGTARRHMEEVAALRKAKRDLGARQLAARASKGYDVNGEGKRYVRRAVRKASMSEEHGERMDREMLEVKRLEQRKQRLEQEQQTLQQRTDIRAVLSIPEQGRPDHSGPTALANDAEATLRELEEQLTNVRTELQFKEGRVKELKELEEPKDEDQLSKIQQTTNTLPQAHTWIRLLFNTLVSMKRTTRQRKDQVQVLQEKLRAVQNEAEHTKLALEQSKFSHDEELMEMTSQHDMVLTSLLEQTHLKQYMETHTSDGTEPSDAPSATGGPPPPGREEVLQRELVRVAGERDSNLRNQISQMQRNHSTLRQQYTELSRVLNAEREALQEKIDDNDYLEMELRNAKRKIAVLKEQVLAAQDCASEPKGQPPASAALAHEHNADAATPDRGRSSPPLPMVPNPSQDTDSASATTATAVPATVPAAADHTVPPASQGTEEAVHAFQNDDLLRDPSLVFAADTLEAIMADCDIISEGKLPPSMQQHRHASAVDVRTDDRTEVKQNSSIFDRLSNPDNFTGVQKHKTFRFLNKKGPPSRGHKRQIGRSRSQPPVQASSSGMPGSDDESEGVDSRRPPRPPRRDSVGARPASASDPQNPPLPPAALPTPAHAHGETALTVLERAQHSGAHQVLNPAAAPAAAESDVFRRLNSPSGFTGTFRAKKPVSVGAVGSQHSRPAMPRKNGERGAGEGHSDGSAASHPGNSNDEVATYSINLKARQPPNGGSNSGSGDNSGGSGREAGAWDGDRSSGRRDQDRGDRKSVV